MMVISVVIGMYHDGLNRSNKCVLIWCVGRIMGALLCRYLMIASVYTWVYVVCVSGR